MLSPRQRMRVVLIVDHMVEIGNSAVGIGATWLDFYVYRCIGIGSRVGGRG